MSSKLVKQTENIWISDLRRKAKRGEALAQFKLGVLYVEGRGVPQDYAKARQWWEQAAAQGNAKAQSNLGGLYAKGDGVPQNNAMAWQWYVKSAAQGDVKALEALKARIETIIGRSSAA